MNNNEEGKYWNQYKPCNIGVYVCQDFKLNGVINHAVNMLTK
jgi:hypothetical protein